MLNTMLWAAFATLAAAGNNHVSAKHELKHTVLFPQRGSHLLYDQSDNDNGIAILATDFEEPEFDPYDCEGADDFRIPAGKTWTIAEVFVAGMYFDSPGTADSFKVTFYSSRKGKVGKVVKSCPNAGYRHDGGFDTGSDYIACKAKLKSGAYFVAVQANMSFNEDGMWGWGTNNTVRHKPSVWRNPPDGLATGCTEFNTTTTCIPDDEGGDFAFALYGKFVAAKDSRPRLSN